MQQLYITEKIHIKSRNFLTIYRKKQKKWRGSVRCSLSQTRCFIKVPNTDHYWTLDPSNDDVVCTMGKLWRQQPIPQMDIYEHPNLRMPPLTMPKWRPPPLIGMPPYNSAALIAGQSSQGMPHGPIISVHIHPHHHSSANGPTGIYTCYEWHYSIWSTGVDTKPPEPEHFKCDAIHWTHSTLFFNAEQFFIPTTPVLPTNPTCTS